MPKKKRNNKKWMARKNMTRMEKDLVKEKTGNFFVIF
ncbi:unnamed protein product [Strongylus vulgaris]|uniref:Uncharacterized protein n=1 Tax=Strongylus vulgaris TaxID=40348 RepID=A0A3P7ITB7_STRVU|nr:unnamed protein product [Strongylus vulgaris]